MSTIGSNIIRARVHGHRRDIGGGFIVSRVLPAARQQAVGPFVFMDHMGPVSLPADQALDVPPHPHIGLATATYLWQGRIEHRDGLGSVQIIEPGAVNWMSAGSGIVHSERTAAEDRDKAQTLHGLQLWVALPLDKEQGQPSFEHTDASALPTLELDGVRGRVVAGGAYGKRSPVSISNDLFYVDAHVAQGKGLQLPEEHSERAAYVIDGTVHVGKEAITSGELVSFEPGAAVTLIADVDTHLVLLGGAPLDGARYLWWNFVASSEARLEDAREAWREKRFPMVAGDPAFIPLPEGQRHTLRIAPTDGF